MQPVIRSAFVLTICLIGLAAVVATTPAAAQSESLSKQLDPQISQGGGAYRDAVGQSATTEIRYYDPNRPAPELSLDEAFEPEETEQRDDFSRSFDVPRVPAAMIGFLVLVVVIFIIVNTVGAPSVSFSSTNDTRSKRADPQSKAEDAPPPEFTGGLNAIRGIADRRVALHLLAGAALMQAAEANRFRISRSWTLRDALARVPAGWTHRKTLADVTRAAEYAHFGGRNVTEETFQAYFDACKPIFGGRS